MDEPHSETRLNDSSAFWTELRRCRQQSRCQEYALVLEALGIEYWSAEDSRDYLLLVRLGDLARAQQELEEYDAENREWPPPRIESPSFTSLRIGVGDLAGYWSVLILFYALETHQAFSLDWFGAGKADALLIRQGEWWRTLTALTLHADGTHLLNNLIFGWLFGVLLRQELGSGLTWLSILMAGAAGNWINAWIQPLPHVSIGASTSVFGGIGLLLVLQRRFLRKEKRGSRLRRWAPFVMAAVFLGFLGTSGERTDVVAHLTGLISGGLFGLVLSPYPDRIPRSGPFQGFLGASALAFLGLAWSLAVGW